MKLRQLRIEGFRSVKELTLDIGDFLCFIGQNNHGKSNILKALELFFSSSLKGVTQDICFKCPTDCKGPETGYAVANEIKIEAGFENLTSGEMEKLGPWTVDGSLTVSKTYTFDDGGKPEVKYEARMRIPKDEWLREDFPDYSKRDVVSKLPLAEFLPPSGRISKAAYGEAIGEYRKNYATAVQMVEERRSNPAGYKQVLDAYLPEYHLVPAVRDVIDETKTSGSALLSRLLGVLIRRIAGQNPKFQDLMKTAEEVKTLIEGKTPDQKLVEIKELEDRLKSELGPWDVDLSIGIHAPDMENLFQSGAMITLDDGIPTDVDEKGHGLQRYLIFALIRVWATETVQTQLDKEEDTRERSHIFAFEEPELFLHPQMCRATYESLRRISETDQILICTHSPHFVNMEDYQHIVLVKKPNLQTGTEVLRVREELFEGERKKRFNMVRFFNPDRNELFFSRKVVLVEGSTEKVVFPLLGGALGCFDHHVSLIDCGSKFNIRLFVDVLNAFQIPYLVVHDEDPVDPELQEDGSRHDPQRLAEAKRLFGENKAIASAVDQSIAGIQIVSDDFEKLLGITNSQIKKFGKPLASVQKYDDDEMEIPEALKELTIEVYK